MKQSDDSGEKHGSYRSAIKVCIDAWIGGCGLLIILWILSEIGLLIGLMEFSDPADISLRGFGIRCFGCVLVAFFLGLLAASACAIWIGIAALFILWKRIRSKRRSDD